MGAPSLFLIAIPLLSWRKKIKSYETMTYLDKTKLIRHIVDQMFDERKNEEEKGKEEKSYEMKTYFDALSNKVMLIYSLMNNRLKSE